VSGTDTVQLTDTHGEAEAFGYEALEFRTGSRSVALAILQNPGENVPTQLCGMAMSPLNECLFTFALDTLEQPIDGRAMYGDRAEPSYIRGGRPLLHLLDHFPPGCLALVPCHHK